ILEDGIVTDSQGRTVSFKNAIIIMTSNIGSAMILNSGKAPETLKEELTQELRAHFRPEFLNRIDEILTFHALGKEEIRKIVDLLLEKVRNRLAAQEITLEVSEEAKNFIGDAGFDPDFGARPLKRAVIQLLETPLSRLLIANTLLPGMNVKVSCADGKLEFSTEEK
ncbi:MAG: AAA family ATPase, partial [Lentisphaeria bacterium]|nr:AAA family ATPase [Lentisphaeria bacterium]